LLPGGSLTAVQRVADAVEGLLRTAGGPISVPSV
jgi:hypothetical protein